MGRALPAVVPVTAPAWKLSSALAVVTAAGTIPDVFAAGILRGPAHDERLRCAARPW